MHNIPTLFGLCERSEAIKRYVATTEVALRVEALLRRNAKLSTSDPAAEQRMPIWIYLHHEPTVFRSNHRKYVWLARIRSTKPWRPSCHRSYASSAASTSQQMTSLLEHVTSSGHEDLEPEDRLVVLDLPDVNAVASNISSITALSRSALIQRAAESSEYLTETELDLLLDRYWVEITVFEQKAQMSASGQPLRLSRRKCHTADAKPRRPRA